MGERPAGAVAGNRSDPLGIRETSFSRPRGDGVGVNIPPQEPHASATVRHPAQLACRRVGRVVQALPRVCRSEGAECRERGRILFLQTAPGMIQYDSTNPYSQHPGQKRKQPESDRGHPIFGIA